MSGFRHWAFIYGSDEEFADQLVPFLRDGIAQRGAVFAVLGDDKAALLTERLGADKEQVHFEDMRRLGGNPGALMQALCDFTDAHRGQSVWGIGEPAWPGRSAAEYDECRHHECLLNVAFEDQPDFNLV